MDSVGKIHSSLCITPRTCLGHASPINSLVVRPSNAQIKFKKFLSVCSPSQVFLAIASEQRWDARGWHRTWAASKRQVCVQWNSCLHSGAAREASGVGLSKLLSHLHAWLVLSCKPICKATTCVSSSYIIPSLSPSETRLLWVVYCREIFVIFIPFKYKFEAC